MVDGQSLLKRIFMRTFLLVATLFSLFSIRSSAQLEANNWYFGDHADITFQNTIPLPRGDAQINSREGCAAVSDKLTGALLFYTDGAKVWNSRHQVMQNGTGLKGETSATQSAVIIPNPPNSLQY